MRFITKVGANFGRLMRKVSGIPESDDSICCGRSNDISLRKEICASD